MTYITTTPAAPSLAATPAGSVKPTHTHGTACRDQSLGQMASRFEKTNSERTEEEEVSRAQAVLECICWLLAGLILTCLVALAFVNGPKIIENVSPLYRAERLNH